MSKGTKGRRDEGTKGRRDEGRSEGCCASRRTFLLAGGTVVAGSALATLFPGIAWGTDFPVGQRQAGKPVPQDTVFKVAKYPRKWVADAGKLAEGQPQRFFYPYEEPHCSSSIVKLGTKAGGGVGDGKDIVAFNMMCPHMGGTLDGQYCHQVKVQGPCPIHLSTFDLTRHGVIVAGHATQSLPQVVLEVNKGQIYAVGVLGLIYGYASNLAQ